MLASGDYLAPPFKRWIARLFLPEESWDLADQDAAKVEIAAHLDVLEDRLRGRDFLAGDAFSLADVAYVPMVCELAMCQLGGLLPPRPAVTAWVERLRARPAVQATSPTS